jgi:hypothetical protein
MVLCDICHRHCRCGCARLTGGLLVTVAGVVDVCERCGAPATVDCKRPRDTPLPRDNATVTADVGDDDPINPRHYREQASGVEVIVITEHLSFCAGNVVKYVLRAGKKSPDAVTDLRKAAWYLAREIARLEKAKGGT